MAYLSVEDYGIIGAPGHVALVSRLGSVDWFCMPRADSPSHFGAILDDNQGGRFQLMPQGDFRSEQAYLQRTHVLETIFETPHGRAILTDWMPVESARWGSQPALFRRIEMAHGKMTWTLQCAPRFDYGRAPGRGEVFRDGFLFRGQNPEDLACLRGTIPMELAANRSAIQARFTLEAGQNAVFCWSWGLRSPIEAGTLSLAHPRETLEYWRGWAHRCVPAGCSLAGPWHDAVIRSALILKLLSQPETGAIAEAATTSIPGVMPNGEERKSLGRNWDYRFSWIRDAAWMIQGLANMGYREECRSLFFWLADLLVRDGADGLQSIYRLDGGKEIEEHELGYLAGYLGSKPVRVGNMASSIFQLDLYGHFMLAASEYFRHFAELPENLWPRLQEIADFVCQAWRRPDHGFWEMRSKPEHHVVSKLFCWVALDRAISLATALRQHIPARWNHEREILHRTICQQGFDPSVGAFVRSFGERNLDSATLLIPMVGFLPVEDPRVEGTILTIESRLSEGALLRRYEGDDGVSGRDADHLVSSLWFINSLALSGRGEEASDRLAEICTYATPLGILGEQIDSTTGETTGNFPCASSHIGIVNSALYVGAARGRHIPAGHLMGWPETPHRHLRTA